MSRADATRLYLQASTATTLRIAATSSQTSADRGLPAAKRLAMPSGALSAFRGRFLGGEELEPLAERRVAETEDDLPARRVQLREVLVA